LKEDQPSTSAAAPFIIIADAADEVTVGGGRHRDGFVTA
jgi:hypothetical protein